MKIVAAWAVVAVPLAYGIVETARRASALFTAEAGPAATAAGPDVKHITMTALSRAR